MGGVVDFLSTEVPEIDTERMTTGMAEIETKYLNSFGGFFRSSAALDLKSIARIPQFVSKTCFPGSTFTNN